MIPSAFINTRNICNIPLIKNKVYQQVIIKLIQALNHEGIYQKSTLCRCQTLQDDLWSQQTIWETTFKTSFTNYQHIYNKYYISKIIDIAHEMNVQVELATQNELPIIPKGSEMPMEPILNQYDTFDSAKHHFSSQNLMFVKQILNNNMENSKIHPWSQMTTRLRKRIIKEPQEYSFFVKALKKGKIQSKKLKITDNNTPHPYNPLSKLSLETNPRTMLSANIATPTNVVNITGRLIKK